MAVLRFSEGGSADFSQGEIYFIGNATMVIRFGGITILTDPAFLHKGAHVDLGHGMWARREVFMSRLDDFKKAAEKSSAETQFYYLDHGETYTFTPEG